MTSEFALTGELAPPMANGELVFEAPWQGRVFGIARSLSEQGLYTWDEFREQLIGSIRRWERDAAADEDYEYFDRFLEALETLLVQRRLLDNSALKERAEEFLGRPHGHDHAH